MFRIESFLKWLYLGRLVRKLNVRFSFRKDFRWIIFLGIVWILLLFRLSIWIFWGKYLKIELVNLLDDRFIVIKVFGY